MMNKKIIVWFRRDLRIIDNPAGKYIRKWIPELQSLPDKYIHKPWEAPKYILSSANITLGTTLSHRGSSSCPRACFATL